MKTLQFNSSRPTHSQALGGQSKKYQIIYADPPWKYRDNPKYKKPWMACNHYPTLETSKICSLPIADICQEDAFLFLWATFPKIFEAQKVITAWGFRYSTVAFVWIKASNPNFPKHWIVDPNRYPFPVHWGMGNWTRSNAEVCLLATRGYPKRNQKGIHQLVYQPVGRHSQKPSIVRQRIIQLAGDKPRIELFARQKTQGWDVWGNEVKPTNVALNFKP